MVIQLLFLTVTIEKRKMSEKELKREQLFQACQEQQREIWNKFTENSRGF
ncbi:uncharacterized protein (TIGR02413 family) [Evansella vedderi]|uniref:Uncharacterized protein (TIGR02413 family) n=1 Tax=Evansella vedderi TaxID=38282 RepID=A0ABU0A0I9_9BACI|nr:YrzI family small protein [Evansella vedderi]MDQ0256527.1 uncharacterized protein (TIGR02413 family) [Evansella vedderi]